ncbi:MAG: hypothetical protein AUJ57_02625 [Zetaproteobacteria bacterium CG1_02_53_45]|nr:MAG: hypothetical protein AUJ57_02625 [Zetaproteobacteria bacterium CG1_02_53_45]
MLIFIHGFNSSGNSDKAVHLKTVFSELAVLTPTCPHTPDDAIALLSQLIEDGRRAGKNIAVIGSSLGGFYAVWLAHRYKLASVLINPLVEQTLLRHEIGPQQNYYTNEPYEWTSEQCDQLDRMAVNPGALAIRPLLLLDEGDELLDSRMAAAHFDGLAETHLFPGGSHRFEHMDQALPLIRAYISKHR